MICRVRKRTGDRGIFSFVSEIVTVKDDRGTVGILETLLGLEGFAQRIALKDTKIGFSKMGEEIRDKG